MTFYAAWFSTPNVAGAEIVARLGYSTIILDVEHGSFDLAELNIYIPLAKSLGLRVLAKTAAPERAAIQQVLDFGADGVVIPHILDIDHARQVCAFAKLPPLGDRSLAGGRTMEYAGFDAGWTAAQNSATACYPMIEHPEALDDIDAILDLQTVDGVFIGPGDLFARRGGGGFVVNEYEEATLRQIAVAAGRAGKPWIMPAWSPKEQEIALEAGAHTIAVLQEFAALRTAFAGALQAVRERESER
jgi:4-hydroxy-2-oxoheptanedioate aldolase